MDNGLITRLVPIAAVIFVAFGVVGLAMPVLPLHVHQRLGMAAFVVGLVASSQFTASLVSRFWAGNYADRRGPKRSLVIGLVVAAASGLVYLASLAVIATPGLSVAILLVGRGVLGAAESFVITGALSWGLALGGAKNAGKVMSWLGIPMYAGFALGAPAGSAIYAAAGFTGVAFATILAPLAALLLTPARPA